MAFSRLLILIFCNVLWASTYALSKNLLDHGYAPLEVAFLRYFFTAVPLVIWCSFKIDPKERSRTIFGAWIRDRRRVDFRLVAVGLLTFFVSPLCQLTGLKLSRAIDGSLMIATEPLMTILLACLFLGERLRRAQVAAIVLAVTGACVVSDVTWSKLVEFRDARLVGNSIFAISMVSEAAYSIVAKPALGRRSPTIFMTVAVCVGLSIMFAYNMIHDGPARLSGLAPLIARRDPGEWASVLVLAWGATLFGYLYWMIALIETPVSALALTLYLQPAFGVLFGYVLVHEAVTVSTLVGGVLILIAMWLGSRPPRSTRVLAQ